MKAEISKLKACYTLAAGFILLMAVQTMTAQTAAAQDGDNPKIGVLNVQAALFNSDAAQVVQEELAQRLEPDRDRAENLQQQWLGLQAEFEQNEAVMTDEEKGRINIEAQDLQVQLQRVAERIQQMVQARNQQFLQEMGEELAAAVQEVVEEGEFDLILNSDAVPHYVQTLDITARVTAKLNENSDN